MSLSKPTKIELRDWEKALYEAFLKKYAETEMNKISIKELCEEVGINRSTFYRSYYDVFDLKSKIEDYYVNAFRCYYTDIWFSERTSNAYSGIDFSNLPSFSDTYALRTCVALKNEHGLIRKTFDALYKDALNFYQERKLQLSTEFESFLHFSTIAFILTCAACLSTNQRGIFPKIIRLTSYICETFFIHGEELMAKTSFENYNLPIKEQKNKERLNVRKTKRSLKNAYIELLKGQPSEKLTVNTLCEKAEVSCSTFYTHYNSLEDFEKKLKIKGFHDALVTCREIYAECGEISDKVKLGTLVKRIAKERELVTMLLSRNNDLKDILKISSSISNIVYSTIEKQYESDFDGKIAMNFICCGAFGELFSEDDFSTMTDRQVLIACYYIFIILYKEKETE